MAKARNEQSDYVRMGIAAMIPGLQRALEVLAAQIQNYKAILNYSENAEDAAPTVAQAASPAASTRAKNAKASANWWAKLTPEQRTAEMARRMKVATGEAKSNAKRGRGNRAAGSYWSKFTPDERKAEMARRLQVRQGIRKPKPRPAQNRDYQAAKKAAQAGANK